ncbi:PorP/SprF family type IX secretion system membrane protein [Muriicola sp. E247]|uniref:PorP/SprF family type IX secretion system membrane protein n=1 Tax=Muriicola sp. E247 TaxID=3242730 RepID=UPI00352560D1
MPKPLYIFFCLLLATQVKAQIIDLPDDFRQHNLNQYNSSLFNPVFSLERNNPQSFSIWSRWQWQQPDADPTTLFANYTHKLNPSSSGGIGFIQQNTGVFLQTGAVLNYAYDFEIAPEIFLAMGINLFGYQQELADDRFQQNPGIGLPFLNNDPSFVLQAAPGIRLAYKNLILGFMAENVFEYNISEGENNKGNADNIFLGSASYSFPVDGSGMLENAFIRPMFFVKSLPSMDTQYGLNTLFATDRIWVQGGYHNFYGFSGGIGGTFFKKFSIGALVEIGNSAELDGKDPTFEIVSSYQFALPDPRRKIVGFEVEEEDLVEEMPEAPKEKKLSRKERKALAAAAKKREQDSLAVAAEKQEQDSLAAAAEKQEQDSLVVAAKKQAQDSLAEVARKQDSLVVARRMAEEKERLRIQAEIQKKKDSLAAVAERDAVQQKKEAEPAKGERFEEAVLTEDIRPGYYLIVNVFGTQRYYNRFMETLKKMGLEPKSFYRTQRKLNYVYLERYNTMGEARKARDSKFDGKYTDTIWIFRVKGK